jgi:chromate reductase, NAD(P)H dehydrogenase (quinone)
MGSARNVAPPWGGDTRLGDRVLKWVKATLAMRAEKLGDATIKHEVSVLDPLEVFGKNGALSLMSAGEMTTPTFFLKQLPPEVEALKQRVVNADCYIVVSPEYNHVVLPALASLMGHFGGSCYACKPSAIVTYSLGPWGGMRAAMSIQLMCHELGCLPVAKLTGVPNVTDLLNVDGSPKDPDARMLKQLPAMLGQLEWMAVAMKRQRDETGVC